MNIKSYSLGILITTFLGINVNMTSKLTPVAAQSLNFPDLLNSPLEIAQFRITSQDIRGFQGRVKAIAVSPNGKILLVATGDNQINAVNTATKQVIYAKNARINDGSSIAISKDGKHFAIAGEERVSVYRLSDGTKLRDLRGNTKKVSDIDMNPAGNRLVSVSSSENTIRIWDLNSGQLLKTISDQVGPVTRVAFTSDGKIFITGAILDDRTLKLWNANSFQLLKATSKQPGFVNDLVITQDGKLIAAVRNFIKSWNLIIGQELETIKGPSLEINAIAVSPDNRTVASANKEGTVMLYDLVTRKITTLKAHQGWVLSVAFSPDGKYLYSGGEDKLVKIWQVRP
ncbi:MAG: WD40 repeat domain-containing protein [Microcystaceae cyanobacterium]